MEASNLRLENITHVNPISITEEYLVKVGFICDGDGTFFKDGKFRFFIREGALSMARPDCVNEKDYTIPFAWIKSNILYIHELQDLYFCLTGQKLTIQEAKSTFRKY
jgi:hypothetical protein